MTNYYANHENAFNEARNAISQKNSDDLNKLMANDEEVNRFVSNLNEVQQMEIIKESLKENTKRLALRNLDKEPILIHEKEELGKIYEELKKTKDEYKIIRQQYDEQIGETNPEILCVLLMTNAAELEQKTEQRADDFFYGTKSEEEVTEFERNFIEDRKRAYELKIKADKFSELIQLSQTTAYLNHHAGGFH